MTDDDITRMAWEAGLIDHRDRMDAPYMQSLLGDLGRFSALVAQHERNACKLALQRRYMGDGNREDAEVLRCIEAIEQRNTK
jgi:hypothetical protein